MEAAEAVPKKEEEQADINLVQELIQKEYYSDEPSSKSFREKTPILIVNDYEKLTNMFGSYWIEPMKEWFKDNFELPVKTIVAD